MDTAHTVRSIDAPGARRGFTFAWRMSFRAVLLLIGAAGGALLFAVLAFDLADMTVADEALRAAEVVLPLMAGMCAALLFAPDDEPILELILTAPRPVMWILAERLIVLIGLIGAIGLAASLVVSSQPDSGPFTAHLLRWGPPTLTLIGVGMAASLWGRRSSYGVLLAIVVSVGMAIAAEALLVRFPDLWPISLYAQARDLTADQYTINRLLLSAIGVGLIALSFIRVQDSEALLGGKS